MAQDSNNAGQLERVTGIDEAAALWSERLREAGDDVRVRRAFEAWCARGPEYLAAYRRVEAAQDAVDAVSDCPELLALRHETLARIAKNRAGPVPARAGRRRRFAAVAAMCATVFIGGLLAFGSGDRRLAGSIYDHVVAIATGTDIYRTEVGEQLSITLDDGSMLTLNTASRVRVAYRDDVRGIKLERGQALFQVAKDASRPFIVTAGERRVTALGTAFDVRLSDTVFEVTLLEGRVTVEDNSKAAADPEPQLAARTETVPVKEERPQTQPRDGLPATTELHPGEQFVETRTTPPVVRAADVRRATSWRNGRVIFEDDRLSAAVSEMNRYSRRRVVLHGEGLGDLRVSGAFNVGQTALFVEALTGYFPITVSNQDEDRIVLAWHQ